MGEESEAAELLLSQYLAASGRMRTQHLDEDEDSGGAVQVDTWTVFRREEHEGLTMTCTEALHARPGPGGSCDWLELNPWCPHPPQTCRSIFLIQLLQFWRISEVT